MSYLRQHTELLEAEKTHEKTGFLAHSEPYKVCFSCRLVIVFIQIKRTQEQTSFFFKPSQVTHRHSPILYADESSGLVAFLFLNDITYLS